MVEAKTVLEHVLDDQGWKTELGWLIELNDHSLGHRWLRVVVDRNGVTLPTTKIDFTDAAVVAMRFAREEDAVAFIYLHPAYTLNCRATEHQFGF